MPLVRIDINKSASTELVGVVSRAVYDAMINIAKVPTNDKFQIITKHEAGELIYPAEGYLGIQYSANIVFIQIAWLPGRSIEVKKAFYNAIAEEISTKGRVAKSDIFINLLECAREDWSFGNGGMQYGPK